MTSVRLQKFLAECGIGSRRHCEDLIAQGRVMVNEAPGVLGQEVEPGQDCVTLDGTRVVPAPRVFVLLNKPRGAVTSTQDDEDRETIFDWLDPLEARVFPIGRLDMDTEGALLLTNDGDLAHRLTRPDCPVERVYIATVRGVVSEATAARMGEGIVLEDGATVHARVRILHTGVDSSVLRIALHEGPSARVRRLGAVLGHPVLELRRIVEAGIELGSLEPGQWRNLTGEEIIVLRQQAGMATAT